MSLRFKLALVVVVGVICAMALAAFSHAWRDADRRLDFARQGLDAIAATLATAVGPPLAEHRYRDVQMILRSIRRMPHVKYAEVRDNDNDLIAAFGSAVVLDRDSALVQAFEKPGLLALLSIKTYPVDVFVIEGSRQVGKLRVIGDVSHLSMALRDSLNDAVFAGMIASLIGFLLSYRLLGIVTRPVVELTSAMRDVRQSNDFSRLVEKRTADETGELVDAFNDMLAQINTRDAAISRHTESLEATVKERTRDLRHAVHAAEEANAAKSDFLATMSHEIRTPMNGMMGMAELLAHSPLSPKQQRYADVVLSSSRSLLAIINDILDLSKIEAGKLELEAMPLDPREMTDRVIALFAQRAAQKDIELRAEFHSGLPAAVVGDPVRLTQIISNLINNSIKFTEEGSVTIAVSYAGGPDNAGRLSLRVSDTGIGIPKDKLERIFEAFSQADQSTTRKYGGTGIGLSICRQLVDAMGGTIKASSQPGRGTSFDVIIPTTISHEVPDSAEHGATPQDTIVFPGVHVLAADDNPVNVELLSEALAHLDVRVTSVVNGRQALDAITKETFDLVFLDGSMPVMDGYQAARAIRSMERVQNRNRTPIVAVTAHVIGGRANQWREAGMDDCITKPFQLADLIGSLTKMLPERAVKRAEGVSVVPENDEHAKPAQLTQDVPKDAVVREADAGPIIDDSVIAGIREMGQGNADLLNKVIKLYAQHAPDALVQLREAISTSDPADVAEKAHALKSLSRNIGAVRVAALCDGIETAGRDGNRCAEPNEVDRVELEIKAAIAELSEMQSQPVELIAEAV